MKNNNKFYFLNSSYSINSASSNRLLAYYRALDELGIKTNVWFFFPDADHNKIEGNYSNVSFRYCWDKFYINHHILKYVSYLFYLFHLWFLLKPGDVIYTYECEDVLSLFTKRKGVKVFYERTESPITHPPHSRIFNVSRKSHISNCKNLSGLFVISTALKEFYTSQGVEADKISIINMIVDFNRFYGLNKNTKKRYIAYCGNGNNKKDKVDELIKNFAHTSTKYPDVDLWLIGPQKQSFEDEQDNESLVKELGIVDRVIFLGPQSATIIPQLLVNAEILAFDRPDTLQNRCGFSTKLGEYLMSGNPVIATETGDTGLFLKDGQSALLVKPDDQAQFKEKIDWALSNTEEARMIGKKGREVALKYFNYRIETEKMVRIMNLL